MLSVITWKWGDRFTIEHVNILYAMCKRNISVPFEFWCMCDSFKRDEWAQFSEGIAPQFVGTLEKAVSQTGKRFSRKNCYRRLYTFSSQFAQIFKNPVLQLDLDIIITDNITDLVTTKHDFIAYRKQNSQPYQGAFIKHNPGTRTQVWDDFDPETSPQLASKYIGSDQAWLSYILPPDEKVYTKRDGLYCYDIHKMYAMQDVPADCKIVFFRGHPKPWHVLNKVPWIKKYYKL